MSLHGNCNIPSVHWFTWWIQCNVIISEVYIICSVTVSDRRKSLSCTSLFSTNCIVERRDPVVVGDVQLCCFSCQLSTSKLCDRTREQMRQAVTQPRCPLRKGHGGEKVPQMGCEVYIHCPLLNRLPLMKCLMLRPYQPNPWWQFIPQLPKNTALWPSLATLAAKHREVPSLNKARQCVIWHANVGHCICKCVITNLHAKTH